MILSGFQRMAIFWFDLPLAARLRLARTIRKYERLSPEDRESFPTQYRRMSPQLFVWVMLRMSVDKPVQAVLGIGVATVLYTLTFVYLVYCLFAWIFK